MAYKAGKLTSHDQSRIQRWALGYYQYREIRDQNDRQSEIEKLLHFILRGTDKVLYGIAFPRPEDDDPDLVEGHSYGVDDLEDLEKLVKKLGQMSTKTQAALNKTEWTEWR